jgi:hypothetical protein
MPFNIEYTNNITVWSPPNAPPDISGDVFNLSIAAELPLWLTSPKNVAAYEHDVMLGDVVERVTVYQDCLKYTYGDHYSPDRTLRYHVLRGDDLASVDPPNLARRRVFEKLRSVARIVLPIRVRNREFFEAHQLRPHCEALMEACNRIMEAERSTYYAMAWNFPYRISFLSVGIYWVSLYRDDERIDAFPFMGNASLLALNAPYPAMSTDLDKIRAAVGGRDAYPDWWLYYCKAATHHGQQNHREAVLEAIIALEMAISRFVRTKWREHGVSNNAIDAAKRDVTLSMMINIELMSLAELRNKPSSELIGRLNRARQLRNEIVHEARVAVSELEAGACLAAVKEALLLIAPDIYAGALMNGIT